MEIDNQINVKLPIPSNKQLIIRFSTCDFDLAVITWKIDIQQHLGHLHFVARIYEDGLWVFLFDLRRNIG